MVFYVGYEKERMLQFNNCWCNRHNNNTNVVCFVMLQIIEDFNWKFIFRSSMYQPHINCEVGQRSKKKIVSIARHVLVGKSIKMFYSKCKVHLNGHFLDKNISFNSNGMMMITPIHFYDELLLFRFHFLLASRWFRYFDS